MKLYKTAKYKVSPESVEGVEKAMHAHAQQLQSDVPGFLWWTVRDKGDPTSYLTLIIAPNEASNEKASESDGTAKFVDALYPNVIGEVEWSDWEPVAYTSSIP